MPPHMAKKLTVFAFGSSKAQKMPKPKKGKACQGCKRKRSRR